LRRETTIASLLIAILLGCSLITYGTVAYTPQNISAQNVDVGGHNFSEKNWSATIDILDFIREKFPEAHIPTNMSLNVYTVWVNESSIPLQMLYLGFLNFTYGSLFNMTIPMQLILEHYRTPNGTNVVLASSFMMLMVHRDEPSSVIPNVPDKNDTVWVSLTIGADAILDALELISPGVNPDMKVHAEALQMNSTANHYEWGMRYTNLVSLWFKLNMANTSEGMGAADLSPLKAISILSELTFIYKMDINPPVGTGIGNATIRMNYRIGEFTDIWNFNFEGNPLTWYMYYFNQTYSDDLLSVLPPAWDNVTHFLSDNDLKLSLAFYQKAALVNYAATYEDEEGNPAANQDMNITVRKIGSYVGGKKILETGLGVGKVPYDLYDGTPPSIHDSVAYTREFHGLRDHNVFAGVTLFLPAILRLAALHLEPHLPSSVSIDFASSDFIFTVSYPAWGGYRIVHDPYFAVYTTSPPAGAGGGFPTLLIVGGIGAVVVIAAVVVFLRRRK